MDCTVLRVVSSGSKSRRVQGMVTLSRRPAAFAGVMWAILTFTGCGPDDDAVVAESTASGTQEGARLKWEYLSLTNSQVLSRAPKGSAHLLKDGLNALGEDGWELISFGAAFPDVRSLEEHRTEETFVFRRQK
jgi:hypothetical protein